MKNVLTLLLVFLSLGTTLSAQTVAVHTVLVPGFLDDPNPVRFSPLNLLDTDPASVFAVTFAKTDPVKPLLTVNLAEPVKLDGVRVRAGWFDDKLFKTYQRAKQVRVWVKQANGALVPAQVFPVKDQMVPQDLVFTKPVEATAVYLAVPETYPGTKNKDLVISSLEALIGGKPLALERTDHGSLVLTVTEEVVSRTDDQGRLVYQATRTRGDTSNRLTRILTYVGSSPAASRESFLGPDGLWLEAWDLETTPDSVRRVKVGEPSTTMKTVSVAASGVPVLERVVQTQGDATVESWYQLLPGDTVVRVPVVFRSFSGEESPRVTTSSVEGGLPRVQTLTWTN